MTMAHPFIHLVDKISFNVLSFSLLSLVYFSLDLFLSVLHVNTYVNSIGTWWDFKEMENSLSFTAPLNTDLKSFLLLKL